MDNELIENYNKFSAITNTIKYLNDNGGFLILLNMQNDKSEKMKDFCICAQILKHLGLNEIKLITSHILKHSFIGLNGFGLHIQQEIIID